VLVVVILLVVFVIVSPLLYKCFCIRKETNIVSVEGITPVVIEPKINEIPIAQAHIIETYPQPTAPQLHIVPTTEKLDIEMGLEDNQK
jgi:hypothetical protein